MGGGDARVTLFCRLRVGTVHLPHDNEDYNNNNYYYYYYYHRNGDRDRDHGGEGSDRVGRGDESWNTSSTAPAKC